MKRKTVLIGIIASVMLCIISIVIITKQEFSTYIILDNEGDAATDEHMIDHLLCKDFAAVSKEDRKVDSYHFSSSETLYKKGGRVYIGEEKKKLVMALPLFMNGGKAVYCYDDGILAITNQFEFVETYQGLYISNGISFNQDMERAYRETFLLLQLNNGTFCNSMELEVSVSALLECVLPQNSIIRFNEDEIRYYSLEDGRFELHSISNLGSSSKIQINDESYGYYDFLEKLGLYSMNDVKEDDEIEESESYQESKKGEKNPNEPTSIEDVATSDESSQQSATETTDEKKEKVVTLEKDSKETPSTNKDSKDNEKENQDIKEETEEELEHEIEKKESPKNEEEKDSEEESDSTSSEEKSEEDSDLDIEDQEKKKKQDEKEQVVEQITPSITPKLPEPAKEVTASTESVETNTADLPEEAEEATLPERPDVVPPVEPETSVEDVPVPTVEPPCEEQEVPSIPWVKPEVSIGEFYPMVYSINSSEFVVLEGSFLHNSGVSFEAYKDGKLVSRKAYTDTSEVKVGSLKPDTEYEIVVKMNYIDRYGRKQTEEIKREKIITKPFSDLPSIQLNWSNGERYCKKIELVSFGIKDPSTDSQYLEMIQNISKVEVVCKNETTKFEKPFLLSASGLRNFKAFHAIPFSTSEILASNSEYEYSFHLFDKYGNQFAMSGVITGKASTCKQNPTEAIQILKNEVKNIQLLFELKNPDAAVIGPQSLYFVVYDKQENEIPTGIWRKDMNGEWLYEVPEIRHPLCEGIETIKFDDLLEYEVYTVAVFASYDVNDGKGLKQDELIGKTKITTAPISSLGSAFYTVNVHNLTKSTADLDITLDWMKTDERLISLIADCEVSFVRASDSSSEGIHVTYIVMNEPVSEGTVWSVAENGTVTLQEEEVKKLGTKTGVMYYHLEGLQSITDYKIIIRPRIRMGTMDREVLCDVTAFFEPNTFKTLRKEPVIQIDAAYPSLNSITLYGIRVFDEDGAIEKYPVVMRVFDSYENEVYNYKFTDSSVVNQISLKDLLTDHKYTFRWYVTGMNCGYTQETYREIEEIYFDKLADLKEALVIETGASVSGDLSFRGIEDYKILKQRRILANEFTSSVSSLQTGNYGARFATSGSKHRSVFKTTLDLSDEYYNTISIGYSTTNGSNDTWLDIYLEDPNTNPMPSPIATVKAYQSTFSIDQCVWTEPIVFAEDITLHGNQTIFVVEQNSTTKGQMSYFWGIDVKKIERTDQWSYYAKVHINFNDVKKEFGNNPKYWLKIYEDNSLKDIEEHSFENGETTKTMKVSSLMGEEPVLIDSFEFESEDSTCDIDYYYKVKRRKNYRMVLSAIIMGYELELDEISFESSEIVRTISNVNELRAIKYNPSMSYVAINDIDVTGDISNVIGSNDWFRGKLDFQGYTLTLKQSTGLFNKISKSAVIRNMRIRYNDSWGATNSGNTLYALCQYNYGTIQNIILERNCKNSEQKYRDWSGGLVYQNCGNGVIENFVIHIVDPWYATNYLAAVACYNIGTIRNGYVYGAELRQTDRDYVEEEVYTKALYFGGITAFNYYSGVIENCYTLNDIYTREYYGSTDYVGTIVGRNQGIVRNCFSAGSVYFDGKIRKDLNPMYKNVYSLVKTKNNYYYSEEGYEEFTNPKHLNKLIMRDIEWYRLLFDNKDTTKKNQYRYDLIELGYYPHVKMPICMPVQEKLLLPQLNVEDTAHILHTEVTKQELEMGYATLTFHNPDGLRVDTVNIKWLNTEVIGQYQDGRFYRVKVKVTLPKDTKYYSSYDITSFTMSYGIAGLSFEKKYEEGEYPQVAFEFYKPITNVTEWKCIKDDLKQNYRLYEDLDFLYLDPSVIVIPSTNYYDDNKDRGFAGKLDGNGKTISNLEVSKYGYVFAKLTGAISNLTIRNMTIDDSVNNHHAFVSRMFANAVMDNVHIFNVRIKSAYYSGALVGYNPSGQIYLTNCSAHNVNIQTTLKYRNIQAVGAIAGNASTITMENCYVDGVELDTTEAFDITGVGGMIGKALSGSKLNNIYAVNGKVKSNFRNAGGIVGSITDQTYTSGFTMSNVYLNLDITSLTDNVGGFIGYSNKPNMVDEVNGLFLGNVYSSNKDLSYVGRYLGCKNYTTNDKATGGLYTYEGSYVNGKLNDPSTEQEFPFTHLSYGELCKVETYGKYRNENGDPGISLSDDFEKDETAIAQGILPKLLNTQGTDLLPYQEDQYIQNDEIKISSVTAKPYSTGENYIVKIKVTHSPNLVVTQAFFDENTRLADVPENVKRDAVSETETDFEYILNYLGYFDTYYLTGIEYYLSDDETKTTMIRSFMLDTMIPPQFLDISDASEWNAKMTSTVYGKKGYNIRLTGDLDFETYGQNVEHDVVVNRMIGVNAKENRIKVKNINLNTDKCFINCAYGSVNQISFENISMTKAQGSYNNSVATYGIIGNQSGSLHDVDFANIHLKSYNSTYTACVAKGFNDNNDITMDGVFIEVTKGSDGSAALVARLSSNAKVYNIIAKNIIVDSLGNYVGGLVGQQVSGSYYSNIDLSDFTVYTSSGTYVGGVAGYAWETGYGYISTDIDVRNGIVLGEKRVGGVYGQGRIYNNPKGGDANNSSNDSNNVTMVSDLFVNSAGEYCGGILGIGEVYRDTTIRNSKIYGTVYVGGATGRGIGTDVHCVDSVVSNVYDRDMGSANNNRYLQALDTLIADYNSKLSGATQRRKEYLEKSINIVKTKRRENTTLINRWKEEPKVENNRYIGGISGSGHLVNACQVTNCEIGSYQSVMVGGLIGHATRYDSLWRSYRYCNSGCVASVVRGGSEIGGLLGRLGKYSIYNCYSNATVIATQSDAGGIVGRYEKTAGITLSDVPRMYNLYFTGSVSARTNVGGIVGIMCNDLHLSNGGYVVAGTLEATGIDGTVDAVGTRYAGDTNQFKKVRIHQQMKICRNGITITGTDYMNARQDLHDKELDTSCVTASDLKKEQTYTSIGWSKASEAVASRNWNYNGLVNNYMPYVTKTQHYTWNSTLRVKLVPYQEGAQLDSQRKPKKDAEGHTLYNYMNYQGGVPIPGTEGEQQSKILMMKAVKPKELPKMISYCVDVDKINLEFNDTNEGASYSISANGSELYKGPIAERVVTLAYDFKTELVVKMLMGEEEETYIVAPENLSRTVMTCENEYFYITGNGIAGSKPIIAGNYIHLYRGKALSIMGEIYNVLTGEVVDHVSEIKKLESTKPLYENVYNGYQLRAYKNYSTSNAEVRNGMRLILHENELFAISTDVSEQPDGILLGHIGTDSYIVQLGKDGKLFQLTDCTVKIPKDFDNQGILQMTNNIDSASSIVLVRYDDGAVAGFNYMTGELLDIDSERASNTNHSISLFKSGKQNASSIGNFANSYLAVEEFQNNLIESGWAQVSGKGTMNGLGLGDDSKDVTITDGDLLTDGLWNKQKTQINENVESASVQNNTTSFVENTSDGLPDSNPIDPSMMDAQRKDTTPEVEGNTNDIETQLVKNETDVVDTTEGLVTSDSTGASNENNTTESAVDSSEVDGTTMESQTDFEEITSANESIIPDSNPQTSPSGEIAANAGGENVPLEVDAKESVTYSVEETEGMQKEESVPTASKEYHEARIKDEVAEEIESSEKEVTIEENSSKIKDKTENTNEKKENKETNEKIRIEADDVTQIPEQAYVPANQNEHTVKSYVKFYDAVKQEYVLYDEEELLSAPTEELVTMNEKVERSGHMIDQHNAYQSESVNANDENRIGVALLILSLLGIGSLLTYLIMRHKKGEGTCE